MALPAVMFRAVLGGIEVAGGWAIPMTTGVAFVLGILGGSLLAALADATILSRDVSLAETDVASVASGKAT